MSEENSLYKYTYKNGDTMIGMTFPKDDDILELTFLRANNLRKERNMRDMASFPEHEDSSKNLPPNLKIFRSENARTAFAHGCLKGHQHDETRTGRYAPSPYL